jgi:hypothetical protein
MEVVCEGVILSSSPATLEPSTICPGPSSTIYGKEFLLAVKDVVVGSIASTRLAVRVVSADDGLEPGTKLIFWGSRQCPDGWKAWGSCARVRQDGTLVLFEEQELNGRRIEGRITASEFTARVRRAAKPRMAAFARFDGLVVARVLETSWEKNSRCLQCRCARVPDARRIDPEQPFTVKFCPSKEAVYREPSIGDTLLIPWRGKFGRMISFDGPPSMFQVRWGFVPALGVSFPYRYDAFESTLRGLRLRPVSENSPPRALPD